MQLILPNGPASRSAGATCLTGQQGLGTTYKEVDLQAAILSYDHTSSMLPIDYGVVSVARSASPIVASNSLWAPNHAPLDVRTSTWWQMWLLWAVRLLASEPRTGPSPGVSGLGSYPLPQWSARPSGHRAKCTWKSELPQGCYMALMHRAVTSRRVPYRPFIGTRSLGNHPVLQRSV